jgi:hypothetical protein
VNIARIATIAIGVGLLAACGQLTAGGAYGSFEIRAASLAEARDRATERCASLGKEVVYQGPKSSRDASDPPPWIDHYTAVYDGRPSGSADARFVFRCA